MYICIHACIIGYSLFHFLTQSQSVSGGIQSESRDPLILPATEDLSSYKTVMVECLLQPTAPPPPPADNKEMVKLEV